MVGSSPSNCTGLSYIDPVFASLGLNLGKVGEGGVAGESGSIVSTNLSWHRNYPTSLTTHNIHTMAVDLHTLYTHWQTKPVTPSADNNNKVLFECAPQVHGNNN